MYNKKNNSINLFISFFNKLTEYSLKIISEGIKGFNRIIVEFLNNESKTKKAKKFRINIEYFSIH